jgi:hypothetical protein
MPARYTIEFMHEIAKENNGKCLSRVYINDDTPLKWMCSKGHTWDYSYTIIRQGGWCVQCIKNESSEEKLAALQLIAKKHGGKCLSPEYKNNHTKLKFQCSQRHIWEATPRTVTLKFSCPYCSGTAPRTIEDMQRKAKERGGICISKKYINSQTNLWWQCKRNHRWKAKPNTIYNGSWCSKCAYINQSERQRIDISVYQRIAGKKGGRLLTKKYTRSRDYMEWICDKKHVWKAKGAQIKNGSWCPFCAGKAKHTIEEMQRVAKLRGGKCLSKKYVNSQTNLLWECKENHKWEAAPTNVMNNKTWCPKCAMKIKTFNLPQYRKMKKPVYKYWS